MLVPLAAIWMAFLVAVLTAWWRRSW